MSPLNPQGDSRFTLAGFLLLAALGASLWKAAPLDSVRPSSEQAPAATRQLAGVVPARLWQDPLQAVYKHEQAVASGKQVPRYTRTPGSAIADLARAAGSGPAGDLTVLAVPVSPGNYPELEERRRRRRYAVISALGEESFVPLNAETLEVFYLRRDLSGPCLEADGEITATVDEKTWHEAQADCFAVPYEWYEYENATTPGGGGTAGAGRRVLLLWLEEPMFVTEPARQYSDLLHQLLDGIGDRSRLRIAFDLLGPARSDALRNLVNSRADAAPICSLGLAEFNVFSPIATVADAELSSRHEGTPLEMLRQKLQCRDQPANAPEMNLLRSIRSDGDLIDALVTELRDNRDIHTNEQHVVLLSEWDTYFGRSLPRAFRERFCPRGCDDAHFAQYKYLRGIDGLVAGESSAASTQPGKAAPGSSTIEASDLRRPVGNGQFDYLRRLANELHSKDRQWRLDNGHGIGAVVLLGSDVYDKLLILRALRPEFPGAVFVTTDLDAQLLHPSEYNWARGMIVASSFGLRTSSAVPMGTMPFRDSYQTSIYLATRLVFNVGLRRDIGLTPAFTDKVKFPSSHDAQARLYDKLPPMLFEIGRQRFIPLGDGKPHTGSWNTSYPPPHHGAIGGGLLAIALLAVFALHQLRPLSGRLVVLALLFITVFAGLGWAIDTHTRFGEGEPVDIFSGVSSWPAVLLRVLSVLLSAIFIHVVLDSLRRNWLELGNRFFNLPAAKPDEGIGLRALLVSGWQRLRAFIAHPGRPPLARVLPLCMFVVLVVVLRKLMPLPLPLEQKIPLLAGVFLALIVVWWLTMYGYLWRGIRVRPINHLDEHCLAAGTAQAMWREYGAHGQSEQRLMRTTGYVLVYFAFAALLFTLLGAPTAPCRGDFACNLDRATTGISVLFMLGLLFLVVDAARLCICWIDAMRSGQLDWRQTRLDDFEQTLKLPREHARAWITVHLIGERTAAVTRLIYYPVIVILLMLLSRSTYFDNWDFPQALAIVVGLNFLIALVCIVRLNAIARSVRHAILRQLQEEALAGDRPSGESYLPSPSERSDLIKQLEALQIGAYLRVWDQPPVRATLMLLGGAALTYAEYLSVLVR